MLLPLRLRRRGGRGGRGGLDAPLDVVEVDLIACVCIYIYIYIYREIERERDVYTHIRSRHAVQQLDHPLPLLGLPPGHSPKLVISMYNYYYNTRHFIETY